MRHDSGFDLREISQSSADEGSTHADSEAASDQLVENKAALTIHARPDRLNPLALLRGFHIAKRRNVLLDHSVERTVCGICRACAVCQQ